ncbi:hypothetical protein B0T20DRAFT_69905 [Sordaria brevicollis]|uniref:Uncharacterized protein n=1 Tax=Sordaria brevicollis TaxID=83679 RepID=A0AAE0P2U3_SORBR|nr:hypothetical protein B0T20DRAFT_69905 [Sordaria brevicollis]
MTFGRRPLVFKVPSIFQFLAALIASYLRSRNSPQLLSGIADGKIRAKGRGGSFSKVVQRWNWLGTHDDRKPWRRGDWPPHNDQEKQALPQNIGVTCPKGCKMEQGAWSLLEIAEPAGHVASRLGFGVTNFPNVQTAPHPSLTDAATLPQKSVSKRNTRTRRAVFFPLDPSPGFILCGKTTE